MKKSTLIVIAAMIALVGVVAWAGATFVIGGRVADRYFEFLKENGHWGPVSLISNNYKRGFFGSKARTTLKITVPKNDPAAKPESLDLVFEHTLRHGPWPFALGVEEHTPFGPALALIGTRLVGVSVNGKALEKFPEGFPELARVSAITRIALNGTTGNWLRIPPFERRKDDTHMKWEGLTVAFESAPDKKTLVGTMDLPGMEFGAPEYRVALNGIHGEFDLLEVLPQLYSGSGEMKLGAFAASPAKVQKGKHAAFQMNDFKISVDSKYDGRSIHYKEVMELAGITVDGKTFGPGILDIEMNHLNGQALSDLQTRIQDFYRQAGNFTPEQLAAQLGPLYLQFFMKMIEGTPELNLRQLHFATPMGDLDGGGQVKFAGEPGLTLNDPAALLKRIEAKVDVAAHESLVRALLLADVKKKLAAASHAGAAPDDGGEELTRRAEQQIPELIDTALAQKRLVREGEKLKIGATLNDGQLLVNGQPQPLFPAR